MMTLALEAAAASAIISWISAAGAVAGTATSLIAAHAQNARLAKSEEQAKQKALQEKLASDAKAAQERSIITAALPPRSIRPAWWRVRPA
jgi:hypothetical protein